MGTNNDFGSDFALTIGDQTWSRQRVREICQTWPGGLYFFTKVILGRNKLTMDLHFAWANFIQMHPWIGADDNNSLLAPGYDPFPRLSHRKTGYMPREHFKSTIISESFPLWLLACVDRNMTIGLVSAVSDNTEKWLKKMRETVQYNPLFRWAFPEIRPGEKWDATRMQVTRDAGGDAQESISALSMGKGLASQHFDYIIIDDPVNEQTAESVVEMERAIRLYYSLEEILKGWRDSRGFLVVGTPWGREDVLHEALKEADRGTRYKWGIGTGCEEVEMMPHFTITEELREKYPAELVPTVDLTKPILPSECDEEKLVHIMSQSRDKLYLNYGCNPHVEGRNGYHLDRIGSYGELPDGQLVCKCHEGMAGHDHHLSKGSVVAVSDPAYTKDKENCETAILIGVKFPCDCRFLLYELGDYILPTEYVDLAPTIANEYKTYLRGWGIEDEALQVTLKQWLEERQSRGLFPPGVTIFGLKVKNREKDGRIGAAATPVNDGKWHVKPTMKLVKGRNNTLHQLFQWPFSNKRDRADAFAYFDEAWEQFPPVVTADEQQLATVQSNKRRVEADLRTIEENQE
jgi:hypothetical protein